MYKIIGTDGKEYGPVDLEQLRQWVSQGRINSQTRVQAGDNTQWRAASEIAEVAALFAPQSTIGAPVVPPVLSSPAPSIQEKGLAIFSFVLGILSFVLCLSALTGIPAIIFGHIARSRATRSPARYGGIGFATAGLVLGYVSILFSLIVLALLLPALAKEKRTAGAGRPVRERVGCENNMRQIGLAFKVWALEHNDHFPFNVSTNSGGTLELCEPGPDGFDKNSIAHFRAISNDLDTPNLLICPNDPGKHAAADFSSLQPSNITYQLRTGKNVDTENAQEVLAVCPVHGNELLCNGNVRKASRARN